MISPVSECSGCKGATPSSHNKPYSKVGLQPEMTNSTNMMRTSMNNDQQQKTRRAFLGDLAITGIGTIFATGLLGTRTVAQDAKGGILATVKLSEEKSLASVGGNVLIKDTAKGDILIVRSSEKGYSAMSNICPHKECKVKVKNSDMIQCPCHRSAYKLDGTYQQGPAKKSLTSFRIVEKDGVLTIYDS